MVENTPGENTTGNLHLFRPINSIKSAISFHKQTLILGLSSSLNGGAAYGYIVSLDFHYFTPALGIVAGLIGGFGVAAKDLFFEKKGGFSGEKHDEDIPLKDIAMNVLFGITALFLGYVLVYYFVKLPNPSIHGEFFIPAEQGMLYDFFAQTMKREDIFGATLGSITSLAIPIIFKYKIRTLMKKLKINLFYSASR
jgi:hypothetical protein